MNKYNLRKNGNLDVSHVRCKESFLAWLRRKTEKDDDVGSFARDAVSDPNFPSGEVDPKTVRTYLSDKGASIETFRAFNDAWRRFDLAKRRIISVTKEVADALNEYRWARGMSIDAALRDLLDLEPSKQLTRTGGNHVGKYPFARMNLGTTIRYAWPSGPYDTSARRMVTTAIEYAEKAHGMQFKQEPQPDFLIVTRIK